jgi:hypothetical protein
VLIEIASYPKFSNTWIRHIVSSLLSIDLHAGIPDLHQKMDKTVSSIEFLEFGGKRYGFYKSHALDAETVSPDKILLIYRHPLDMFLSSINYAYIRVLKSIFFDGKPKSVDDLEKEGALDAYFEDFLGSPGLRYYRKLLGND